MITHWSGMHSFRAKHAEMRFCFFSLVTLWIGCYDGILSWSPVPWSYIFHVILTHCALLAYPLAPENLFSSMECIRWGFKSNPVHQDFPAIISFTSDPEAKGYFSQQQKEFYRLPSGLISHIALRVSWPSVLQSSCRISVQFLRLFPSAEREPFISNPSSHR